MISFYVIVGIISIFIPSDVVTINHKLQGYWLVVEDYSDLKAEPGQIRVLKFNKCTSEIRQNRHCEYGWCYLDNLAVVNNRLDKSVQENWNPCRSSIYWVDKKKNKDTNRYVIHMISLSEICLSKGNKELSIYQDNKLIYRLTKLK